MKANVYVSVVKKVFTDGQQGWQVFVEGMEGRLQCKMHFRSSLKAMRYCFVLSKRLNLAPDEEFQIIPRIPELVLWMSAYESGRRVDPKIIASLDILKKI